MAAAGIMQIFLSAFDTVPDPRASNARHDLGEVLVLAFVSVLCGSTSCAEMAAFGRAKESFFMGFLNLKHSIPSHDTFSDIFRMIDPKALDAAFGKVLADVVARLKDGDVIAIPFRGLKANPRRATDGKALRGARDTGESARTRMMVSACAARLRLTLATVPADRGTELDAAIEALGLIALRGKVITGDASHCNRRTGCRDQCRRWRLVPCPQGQHRCLALKGNTGALPSRATRSPFYPMPAGALARIGKTIQWPSPRKPAMGERRSAKRLWCRLRHWMNVMNSPASRGSAASRLPERCEVK